ncbi:class I adenylate-forming enzyme family protein [Thermodesulfobacteriota bacterium]
MGGEKIKIGNGVKVNARKWPHKTAVIFKGKIITYQELNTRANRFANRLLDEGFTPGDKICIMSENCPEFIEAAIALAKIGVAWVPVNYRFKENEAAYLAQDANAKGFIVDSTRAELIRMAVSTNGRITLNRCFVIGESVPEGMKSYHEAKLGSSPEEPTDTVDEHDLLYIGYTSGTTGKPKGAQISHRNRILCAFIGGNLYGITKDSTTLITPPLYHTATMSNVLRSLYLGGRIVLLPGFDATEVLKAVETYEIASVSMVPTMINRLIGLPQDVFKQFDLSSLKMIISGASPLPTTSKEWILKHLPQVKLYEFYGATEAGLITVLYPEDQHRKVRCVGQPVIQTEIRILDEDRNDLPPGEVGEIFIKSLTTINSYHNLPEESKACFEDEFITLGDMGRMDEEGYLYIVDRKKEMINSGGVNIFPREIEDAIMAHTAVQEVAVIGVPDKEWGESVKAVIELKPGSKATEREIKNFCRERIADFKTPKSVDFVAELPKTPFGKTLKRLIRDEYWKDQEANV